METDPTHARHPGQTLPVGVSAKTHSPQGLHPGGIPVSDPREPDQQAGRHSDQREGEKLKEKSHVRDPSGQPQLPHRHTSVHSSRSSMSLRRWNTMFLERASSSSGATSGNSSHCRSNTFSWLWVTCGNMVQDCRGCCAWLWHS